MNAEAVSTISTYFRVCDGVRVSEMVRTRAGFSEHAANEARKPPIGVTQDETVRLLAAKQRVELRAPGSTAIQLSERDRRDDRVAADPAGGL